MTDVNILASHHPYTVPPSAGQMGKWAACFCIGAGCLHQEMAAAGNWPDTINFCFA
jgi:hypothetical protein